MTRDFVMLTQLNLRLRRVKNHFTRLPNIEPSCDVLTLRADDYLKYFCLGFAFVRFLFSWRILEEWIVKSFEHAEIPKAREGFADSDVIYTGAASQEGVPWFLGGIGEAHAGMDAEVVMRRDFAGIWI
jgi:hypothetical protein